MAKEAVQPFDPVAGLLGDLDTITSIARSGIRHHAADQLEPGETRPAAILFIDVVGFTALARALDTENLSRLIDRTFRIFELTVKSHGGYCDKVIGDAALYVFAGHISYEPPCQAALSSALGLLERIRQINQSLESTWLALNIRAGVTYGTVTRQRIGGESQQVTVMGETVNLAQRLEAACEPGCIFTVQQVVDETASHYQFRSRGKSELKGFEPQEVFSIERELPREVRLRGSGMITPLVGRDALIETAVDTVKRWWTEGRHGGRLLLLQGPTAVGKSRTAWELIRRLGATQPTAHATAHCTPQTGLLGFAAELCSIAGIMSTNLKGRWDELTNLATQLRGIEYAADLSIHLPLLGYLLSAPDVDTAGIRQADSKSFALACKLALIACCELAALEGTHAVLVVEDLQWLGEQSDLLTALLNETRLLLPSADGALQECPLVCIATARLEYDAAELPRLLSSDDSASNRYSRLEVRPLDDTQGDELFAKLLPGISLPEHIATELHEKSLGLPYYYEEMARLLLRRGIVEVDGDGAYRLAQDIGELEMPEDFRALILGRLDLLPAELRELAKRASVIGRSFDNTLLSEIEQQLGLTSEMELRSRLEALEQEQLITRESDGRYLFVHALTHSAAYSALLHSNLRVLHGAIADSIRRRIVPGTASERELRVALVEHLESAQRMVEACNSSCDMLMYVARGDRHDAWDGWNQRTVGLLENVPAVERPLLDAKYLWATGVRDLRNRKEVSAQELLEAALPTIIAQSEPAQEIQLLLDLGAAASHLKDAALAAGYYNRALELAKSDGLDLLVGTAYNHIGDLHKELGQISEAIKALESALAIFEQVDHQYWMARTLSSLGACLIDVGRFEDAEKCFSRGHKYAAAVGDTYLEIGLLHNQGVAFKYQNQFGEAEHAYEVALMRGQAINWRLGQAYAHMSIGDLKLEQDQIESAISPFEESLRLFEEFNSNWGMGVMHTNLGEVKLKLGRPSEAKDHLLKADSYLKNADDAFRRGLAQCTWIRYYLAESDVSSANTALMRAHAFSQQATGGQRSLLDDEIKKAEVQLAALRP